MRPSVNNNISGGVRNDRLESISTAQTIMRDPNSLKYNNSSHKLLDKSDKSASPE